MDIAKATLYKHFDSKESLAAARIIRLLERALAFLASLPPEMPAAYKVRAVLRWAEIGGPTPPRQATQGFQIGAIVTGRCQQSSRGSCMLIKPEDRARITTQVAPCVARAAAEAISVTHGTGAPRRARSDPFRATKRCADRIRSPAPASPSGRTRSARHRASRTAAGHGPAPWEGRARLTEMMEDSANAPRLGDDVDDVHHSAAADGMVHCWTTVSGIGRVSGMAEEPPRQRLRTAAMCANRALRMPQASGGYGSADVSRPRNVSDSLEPGAASQTVSREIRCQRPDQFVSRRSDLPGQRQPPTYTCLMTFSNAMAAH